MNPKDRIHELEDEIKQRDRRIEELRQERDAERVLVAEQREYVEDANALIERWIEAFEMTPNDKGDYVFREELLEKYETLGDKHHALIKEWNKFVPKYNARVAPRNFGRPLAASEVQRLNVLKLRDSDHSLRDIADEMNLSLRTVRTIVDKRDRKDRGTAARLQRIAPDRLAIASERASRRARAALPGRINAMRKRGAELIKRAKGL